jgi:dTDP-4-dehydrorhamnose 3,5-epimerase
MFEKIETQITGCFEIRPRILNDDRGSFVKTFHYDAFKALGIQTEFKEEYYSKSKKNVIRGLHFQQPPFDHEKLVYCTAGEVLDVAVDLRRDSKTYGRYVTFNIDAVKGAMVYLPKGIAHGFVVLSEEATMMYKVSTVYAPESDSGILWSSIDFMWPVETPIVSMRDSSFAPLHQFDSPFRV